MNKILLFTLFIIICFLPGFNTGDENFTNVKSSGMFYVSQQYPVPDVMGNICFLENDGSRGVYNINESDTFPNFSGFPKTVTGSTSPYEGGIICNMDADPDFEIVYNIGFTVQAWNFDGSSVPGWPKTVSTYPLECAPSFGDIDGDGQEEIVVTNHGGTSGGSIYAFHKDGSTVSGFPISHGYSSRTPVLANLDNTGGLEIIVNRRESNEEWVYRGNGTVFPGWPKSLNHVPASSAAVGDITGDNIPEVIAESYSSLYAWHADGSPLSGFPYTMPNSDVNSYSAPVLADLDGDNIREIVFGTHALGGGGYVYALKNNATNLPGWPQATPYWIYSPPAVGFIDGDNVLDIAIGDGGGTVSGTPVFKLYAWNKNGTSLSGFPVAGLWAINNEPLIADIDNDNSAELIIDDNTTSGGTGKYLAFNHNGTPLTGNWPIYTTGGSFFSTPMLWDVNRDGILDIAGTGWISPSGPVNVYLWNTGITFNTSKITVPMWRYNSRHNGVYGDNGLVAIAPVSNEIPKVFSLMQNYPNPFNPATRFRFQIAESGLTTIKIYDILGSEVTTLLKENLQQGTYELEWNAANYPSGIYYYKIVSGRYVDTKKMVLVK